MVVPIAGKASRRRLLRRLVISELSLGVVHDPSYPELRDWYSAKPYRIAIVELVLSIIARSETVAE